MSVLAEFDEIRSALAAPGQPFELEERSINGAPMQVYKHLPPNLSHIIVAAETFADRTFVVRGEKRWTYAEFLARAAGFANVLRGEHGVAPGTRVAIAMRNSPGWILGFFAAILNGATPVAINSRGAPDEMAHALENAQAVLLLADKRRADALEGLHPVPVLIAVDDGDFSDRSGKSVEIESAPIEPSNAAQEDPALILFTSGTTGRPKGAVLSHRSVGTFLLNLQHNGAVHLVRNARKLGMAPEELAAVTPQFATIATWPFFHMSGATSMILGATAVGGKIVMMERWDPKTALAIVEREKITVLQGPPSVFWDLLACPNFAQTDLSSVTAVFSGGQALSTNLLEAMVEAFPGAMFGGGFGMTEANGPVTTSTGDEYLVKPKAAGRVVPGTELRIVDANGRDQPLGEPGEIWVRSPLVMSGYWNNPEATDAAFDNGWLKTGDVGFLDADGFVTVVDRIKDMIIRSGENIYCAELERVFQEYPGMMEAAAFGVPEPRLGERVVLAIVPHPGQKLDAEEILEFARGRLADYKVPSEIIVRNQPFERNALGKIDKIVLRRSYAAEKEEEERDVISG